MTPRMRLAGSRVANLWVVLERPLENGARALELSLDQAAVNRALANRAGAWSVDVTFVPAGIVVGVVAQLGALRLPRGQYALGVAARRGRIEVDVTEALRIPGAGPKIAAMLDAAARLDGLAIRRRGNRLTVGHPWFRCERAASENGTLRVTLTARDGLQGLKRRRKSSANRS